MGDAGAVPLFREAGLDVVALAGLHRNRTREATEKLFVGPFDEWRSWGCNPRLLSIANRMGFGVALVVRDAAACRLRSQFWKSIISIVV